MTGMRSSKSRAAEVWRGGQRGVARRTLKSKGKEDQRMRKQLMVPVLAVLLLLVAQGPAFAAVARLAERSIVQQHLIGGLR